MADTPPLAVRELERLSPAGRSAHASTLLAICRLSHGRPGRGFLTFGFLVVLLCFLLLLLLLPLQLLLLLLLLPLLLYYLTHSCVLHGNADIHHSRVAHVSYAPLHQSLSCMKKSVRGLTSPLSGTLPIFLPTWEPRGSNATIYFETATPHSPDIVLRPASQSPRVQMGLGSGLPPPIECMQANVSTVGAAPIHAGREQRTLDLPVASAVRPGLGTLFSTPRSLVRFLPARES